MTAQQRGPGAKSGAEGAEVRKASIHAGLQAGGRCGRSAEEVRKHTVPVLPAPALAPTAAPPSCPPAPGPAAAGLPLGLVRAHAPEKPREDDPGPAPYGPAVAFLVPLRASESTPGAGEPPAVGQVLTHPAFDRPPVENERRRGRPRRAGTVSLAEARRRKAADALRAEADERARIEAAAAAPHPGRIDPPTQGPGAASAGALLHAMREATGQLDRDARGLAAPDRAVIEAALAILGRHLRTPGAVFDSPTATRDFLRLHLAGWDRERFAVLFLDAQHRLIELEVIFEGTLTQTSVFPRDVARRALHWNAAAVILAHNHPSGVATPSPADRYLTQALRQALALVDTRVLDHLVIGWPDVVSLAERGLM